MRHGPPQSDSSNDGNEASVRASNSGGRGRGLAVFSAVLLVAVGALAMAASMDGDDWAPVGPGLDGKVLRLRAPKSQLSVEFHVLRVDLERIEIRAVDARAWGEKASTAAEMQRRSGALAVINGSFFDTDLKPMGLLISESQTVNKLRRADWGVFTVSGARKATLVHTRDYSESKGGPAEFAIQSGPRLVVEGKPLSMKPNLARRSALCIRPDGQTLIIATAGPVLLEELAEVLSRSDATSGFGCEYALNLDGGSSTQLHVGGAAGPLGFAGSAEVPIGLGLFER